MLLAREKITQDMIALLDKWRHTGFNVYAGPRILPHYENALENLARYIIRASFSLERMTCHRDIGQVECKSKDGVQTKAFDAVEWLAAMCSHVPNKGEQMVRYYGYYSNVARGKRKKADSDLSACGHAQAGDKIPCILEPELTGKAFRKNWARLIQKIYPVKSLKRGSLAAFHRVNEVDPLICSKCQGQMRVIAFIHDEDVIRKILKHLGLWDVKRKLPPRLPLRCTQTGAHGPPFTDASIEYNETPGPDVDAYNTDPQYPVEAYF